MSGNYSVAALARQKVSDAMLSGDVYMLGGEEVVDVLRSYVSGDISASDVEEWAEIYDVNDGVEFECEDHIKLIFELSTPEVNGLLTLQRAEEIIDFLVGEGKG